MAETNLHERREETLADGTKLVLMTWVYDRGDHIDRYEDLLVRTRTGKKVHAGSAGSSVTRCGVRLRTNGNRMMISPSRVRREHLCESCFPAQAAAAKEI